MMRLVIFVGAILAYSSIGLVAFSQLSPTVVAKGDPNVTVVHKTSAWPVLDSPVVARCAVGDCVDGINI